MRERLRRTGKFYSRLILSNIGIFIFVGILSVVSSDHGWFPNENIYAISQFVYEILVPCMIGYRAGVLLGGESGGIVSVLAVTGVIVGDTQLGILGAMVLGPAGGLFIKIFLEPCLKGFDARLHMLVKNILLAVFGIMLSVGGFYLLTPVFSWISHGIALTLQNLIEKRLIVLGSILIEPAKIFFLNNNVNHGILAPLGMQQVMEGQKSLLFLLETNPGPGLGLLAALLLKGRGKEEQYGAAMFAQSIGGIHEVYFPFVLSNMKLLLALITGGMAGTFIFATFQAGVGGPVSPGSVLTILLMAGKDSFLGVFLGIGISALTAFGTGLMILGISGEKETAVETAAAREEPETLKKIKKIGFVCDSGVGSSVMGAALFRRILKEQQMEDIEVSAFASDQIIGELDLLVCQKDFAPALEKERPDTQRYVVDNFVSTKAYGTLLDKLRKRNE